MVEVLDRKYSLSELSNVAEELIKLISSSNCWLFVGEIGAGKTTLIKEILRMKRVLDEVTSPTFTIINQYKTADSKSVYHIDLYRLKDVEEAIQIGIEDVLDSDDLTLIEWPQIIEEILPEHCVLLKISSSEEGSRRVRVYL